MPVFQESKLLPFQQNALGPDSSKKAASPALATFVKYEAGAPGFIPQVLNTFSKGLERFGYGLSALGDVIDIANTVNKANGNAKFFEAANVGEVVARFKAAGFDVSERNIQDALSGSAFGTTGAKIAFTSPPSGETYSFELNRDADSGKITVSKLMGFGLLTKSNEKLVKSIHNSIMHNEALLGVYENEGKGKGYKGPALGLYVHWRADRDALLMSLDTILSLGVEKSGKLSPDDIHVTVAQDRIVALCFGSECLSADITKEANNQSSSGRTLTSSEKKEIIKSMSEKYLSAPKGGRAKPSRQYAAALGSVVNEMFESYLSLATSSASAEGFMMSTFNTTNELQTRETTRAMQETSDSTRSIAKKKKEEKDEQDGKTGSGFT